MLGTSAESWSYTKKKKIYNNLFKQFKDINLTAVGKNKTLITHIWINTEQIFLSVHLNTAYLRNGMDGGWFAYALCFIDNLFWPGFSPLGSGTGKDTVGHQTSLEYNWKCWPTKVVWC